MVNSGLLTEKNLIRGTYIRSFYIEGDDIYLVSGIRGDGTLSGIIIYDKATLTVKEVIDVPDDIAGMVSMRKDRDYYYITVSTDVHYDQSAADMIRTKDLHDLKEKGYETVYECFIGGGTPYNMVAIGGGSI